MKDIDIIHMEIADDIYTPPPRQQKPNDYDAGYINGYADGKIEALKIEIVRCRDCAFCDAGRYFGICHKFAGTAVELGGFCSWGIIPKEETE